MYVIMTAHIECLLCALHINKYNTHDLCHQEAPGLVGEIDCKSNNQTKTSKMAYRIRTMKEQSPVIKIAHK